MGPAVSNHRDVVCKLHGPIGSTWTQQLVRLNSQALRALNALLEGSATSTLHQLSSLNDSLLKITLRTFSAVKPQLVLHSLSPALHSLPLAQHTLNSAEEAFADPASGGTLQAIGCSNLLQCTLSQLLSLRIAVSMLQQWAAVVFDVLVKSRQASSTTEWTILIELERTPSNQNIKHQIWPGLQNHTAGV